MVMFALRKVLLPVNLVVKSGMTKQIGLGGPGDTAVFRLQSGRYIEKTSQTQELDLYKGSTRHIA